jgi:hypothetical protein
MRPVLWLAAAMLALFAIPAAAPAQNASLCAGLSGHAQSDCYAAWFRQAARTARPAPPPGWWARLRNRACDLPASGWDAGGKAGGWAVGRSVTRIAAPAGSDEARVLGAVGKAAFEALMQALKRDCAARRWPWTAR